MSDMGLCLNRQIDNNLKYKIYIKIYIKKGMAPVSCILARLEPLSSAGWEPLARVCVVGQCGCARVGDSRQCGVKTLAEVWGDGMEDSGGIL